MKIATVTNEILEKYRRHHTALLSNTARLLRQRLAGQGFQPLAELKHWIPAMEAASRYAIAALTAGLNAKGRARVRIGRRLLLQEVVVALLTRGECEVQVGPSGREIRLVADAKPAVTARIAI